ncbi:PPP4R2-domain-containing protein [Coemansia reversa NRRL 1564]|uniref:PPP4R2-domain-containing protein n=1 Tax=Coemansia reversa (strain ATCC 12441 / NRRL 1564) TaxID=763665 RepID=A0A2G5B3W7_COERN|nr:PPP4R2-domain-containing protein [Coemansia reversa NRRL 1564]|eukprot:PIA13692.1 PPP4R2-domain-containing protein [Coemansia reversa NRRL 1564]
MSQASEGPSSEPWDKENDKLLERLALNEENRTPWPELRRIIRQRLAMVVEQLTENQNKDADVQRQELEGSGRPESAEKRKRSRVEDNGVDEMEAVDSSVRLAGTEDNDKDTDNRKEVDKNMDTTEEGNTAETPFQNHSQSADRLASVEDGVDEGAGASTTKTQTPAPQPAGDGTLSLAHNTNGNTDDLVRDIRDLEDRIGYSLHTFEEAPFTIQRIAELLAWPERHYRNVIKFLRAVERVVYVTSTVEEFPTLGEKYEEGDAPNGEAAAVVAETIESDSASNTTATPSSLLSFMASQRVDDSNTNALGNVAKDTSFAATMTAAAVFPSTEQRAAGNAADGEPTGLHVNSAPTNFANQEALPLTAGAGALNIPPLDASDTGILHLQPTLADDRDALRTKFEGSVDAGVPVCIDELDGTSGKVTVVPIDSSDDVSHKDLKNS